jgi:hypothetical protein
MPGDGLQRIVYRGGRLTFRIPAAWTVEFGSDGGGTFYDPRSPDAGVLRLSVLAFRASSSVTPDALRRLVAPRDGPPAGVETLPNGNALRTYTEPTEEDGEPLATRYRELAHEAPPSHARLAVFSYALPAAQTTTPAEVVTTALLDREIRAAAFSPELGGLGGPAGAR